ncbi:MlaE family lipid ABC transporter permease subunit [Roseofilum casamattae]|uniref:MlaE family lipid ABC transporter permease subunit n=1 Tax=Roseofilum casamattae BLCC-M143 TaxID=3022442 RepID=A0ABT7BSX2_9CYAN|nr:MlaE family lipid ABC transporter permease subunit [Roseofilum casamattae]MDJ1182295.1 MlaE family lipid ABC transporter permease subunit [Roseofilum casamattae BLCC-M143]
MSQLNLSSLGVSLQRPLAAIFLGGQAIAHILAGKIHRRNTLEQMANVGPASLAIAAMTATSVGFVFTIQVAREFINFGATAAVGGILSLALARELSPVLTSVVVAGRVSSAFAAEIGTMQVTEQIDALYMLKTDPIDYLVIPRLIACCLMLPLLTLISLVAGVASGMFIARAQYNIPTSVFLSSVQNFMTPWDVASAVIKSAIFGALIAIIGCSWGLTTTGGAKGVGLSTTTSVVVSLLAIFITDFGLSWIMFQGVGSSSIDGL